MKINWTGKPITVSSGVGGGAGGRAGGAGGNITLYGGAGNSGSQNIVIGAGAGYMGANQYTIFSQDSGEWLKYKNETNKAQVKLSSGWVLLEPRAFKDMHQLDLGAAIDTKGKEDLDEIREQYEEHIKNSPWLEKLRNNYNDLVEKHKLFDAIKGDDDA